MLLLSVFWMVKYFHQTLISNLDLFQMFSALGIVGKVSLVISLIIIGLILHSIIKRNMKASGVLLCLLFFQSTLFFIMERLYEIYFMYITVLIVATTFVWANFFLLACVSGVSLLLSFLTLIFSLKNKN